jgi:hypothetical protein
MEKFMTDVFNIAGLIIFGFLLAWPIMMLWNGCLVPAVVGLHLITWFQAWGIEVLVALLFNLNTVSKS